MLIWRLKKFNIYREWINTKAYCLIQCRKQRVEHRTLRQTVHYCHRSSVRPNLKTKPLHQNTVRQHKKVEAEHGLKVILWGGLLTYPKKMNAFWKKMAIPGYTTGFSAKDNRFTEVIKTGLHILFCKLPHMHDIFFTFSDILCIFSYYSILPST